MKLVVLANDSLKEELLAQGLPANMQVEWISDPAYFSQHSDADAFIDLLFINEPARIGLLNSNPSIPVIINYVTGTLQELPSQFVRINAWVTFLKRPLIEATAKDEMIKDKAAAVFSAFGKTTNWVPDIAGFISARVVATIINEAFFSLEEGVSTKEDIDIAMKSGTNYPYGPFEWAEKIGLENILALLTELHKEQPRYQPALWLIKEAIH
jgi:3-hydroxybutyryl-CoA dehydrogenase